MSYTATIEGKIVYDSKESLEKAVLDFQEVCDSSNLFVDDETNTLYIQTASYSGKAVNNLHSLFNNSVSGCIAGTSADVNWHGFVYTRNTETELELEEWAAANGFSSSRPDKENFTNEDDWWDKYVEWQTKVEAAFRNQKCESID